MFGQFKVVTCHSNPKGSGGKDSVLFVKTFMRNISFQSSLQQILFYYLNLSKNKETNYN